MNLELYKNIWESDSGLGFYCVNIIRSSKPNPSLTELLRTDILKEREFGDISTRNKILKGSARYYGPLLKNKINESDFKKLTFPELESEIEIYWRDENWGEDLPVFKKNFRKAKANLHDCNLENRIFYLANADMLSSEKLTDPNFFTYFVCIISTEPNSNDIITLTFGLD